MSIEIMKNSSPESEHTIHEGVKKSVDNHEHFSKHHAQNVVKFRHRASIIVGSMKDINENVIFVEKRQESADDETVKTVESTESKRDERDESELDTNKVDLNSEKHTGDDAFEAKVNPVDDTSKENEDDGNFLAMNSKKANGGKLKENIDKVLMPIEEKLKSTVAKIVEVNGWNGKDGVPTQPNLRSHRAFNPAVISFR